MHQIKDYVLNYECSIEMWKRVQSEGFWSLPRVSRWLIYIALAIGAIYNQSFGIPESWPSDELTWMAESMVRRGSFAPDTFYYPAGPFIYPAFLLTKVASFFTADETQLTVWAIHISRSLSALFFLLTIGVVERLIRFVFRREQALFAIVMTGGSLALIHHAHLATINSGAFFAMVLTVYFLAKTIIGKKPRDFYLAVAACSLATGFKYNSVFLFIALPLVWVLSFGSIFKRQFVVDLAISLIIAPLPLLLTNPYLILESGRAKVDILLLLVTEIPAFQVTGLSLSDKVDFYYDRFLTLSYGFFTVPVFRILLATLSIWLIAIAFAWFRRKDSIGESRQDLANQQKIVFVLLTLFAIHTLTNFNTGILQSRYYIPGLLFLLLAFLIAIYGLYQSAITNHFLPLRMAGIMQMIVIAVMAVCSFFTSLNAYVHVASFSWAPKSLADQLLLASIRSNPTARIGVIAYPQHSPFQRGNPILESRLDVFMTMIPPRHESIDTWDEYLASIEDYFREKSPRYIIAEDLVFAWTIFLPKKYEGDYGKRLLYPNPGFDAWKKMFEDLGYQQVELLTWPNQRSQWLEEIMSNHYSQTTEGVTGNIYIFEKKTYE